MKNPILPTAYVQTPFGIFEIQGTEKGVSRVQLCKGLKQKPHMNIPAFLKEAVWQLNEYFKGKRQEFDLQLDLSGGTPFNQSVWKILQKVPYGQTTTYLKIARQLNNPKAVRAVGMANKLNPMGIIIPCHRCIASNGDLQGYFYGLDVKHRLLELENPMSFARQGSLF